MVKIRDLDLPVEGYVRLPQILHALPIGRSTWWQGVKEGRYPASIKLGERTTVWRVEDIRNVIAAASEGEVINGD
mgnify:CR=1 FL=1